MPLNAEVPESTPMCPTLPYDVVFGTLTPTLECGKFTLDVGVSADDYPIEDIKGISFEIIISNYMDFELDETLTETSMNTLFADGDTEVDYNSGTGQMIISGFFFDNLDGVDKTPLKNYAQIVTLFFTLNPGTSTNISYGTNSTLAFDFNGDGVPEACLPDNISSPVPASAIGYTISGEFETMNTQNYSCGELVDVNIEFSDAGGVLCDDDSDSGGEYESCGLCPGGSYRATPISGPLTDTLCGGAIDTSDLVAIQNHLLLIQEFTKVWQYFAADVNGSLNITAKDLLILQKALLGQTNPDLVPWTYWTKASIDAIILPHADPLGAGVQYLQYSNLSENKTMKDFYGVRTMQVHLDGQPCNCANNVNSETQARALNTEVNENLIIKDRYVQPGEQYVLSIQKPSNTTFMGIDISLKCENGLEFQHLRTNTGINLNKIAESYRITDNKQSIRLMFSHVDPEFLNSTYSGDLLHLTVRHTGSEPLWLSEMLQLDEVHGSNFISINQNKPPQLNLLFTGRNSQDIQVVPNPVGTDFRYYTDSEWENITIFDLSGKALRAWDSPLPGVMYSLEGIPAGMYILRFNGSHNSKSVRIIKR